MIQAVLWLRPRGGQQQGGIVGVHECDGCDWLSFDGEAVCCNEAGAAVFEKLHRRADDDQVFLYAFELLELDGEGWPRPLSDAFTVRHTERNLVHHAREVVGAILFAR